MRYTLINTKTGEVAGTYSTMRRANAARDRKETAYGSCVFKIITTTTA